MVRLLYILGGFAIFTACGVFVLWLSEPSGDGPRSEDIYSGPGAIQTFTEKSRGDTKESGETVSPLVSQAQAFALYLNPPGVADEAKEPPLDPGTSPQMAPVLPIRPPAPSVRFRLHGTSYYPNQPHRSMALIAEVGSLEGNERWVKEGSRVGHFVIHEIRQGAIAYRDGDQLREMTVRIDTSRSLVRDIRPGSHTVSAAIEGAGIVLPSSAGPDNVSLGGN